MSERVVALDLGCQPAYSGSAELVVQGIERCFVLFLAIGTELSERGTLPDLGIAVVECVRFSLSKHGYPNDEGRRRGHHAYSAELSECPLQIAEVLDSSWLHAEEARRAGSQGQRAETRLRHFVFSFKESTLDVLAHDLRVELHDAPYEEVARATLARALQD